jgi:hypothetical protein
MNRHLHGRPAVCATIGGIHPADRSSEPGLFANPTPIVIGLLLAIRLFMGAVAADSHSLISDVDIARFHQIATADGRPYRVLEVEYAPAETAAIKLLAGGSLRDTALRVAVLALACDLLGFAGLWYGWGRRPAALYLLIGLPLVPFIYSRLDPLVVMLAIWGLAFARRDRERAGGATLALAGLTKLWPLIIAPALLVERRMRAARWFACLFIAGVIAWIVYGGADAIRQVVSFRDATGWEIESTVGTIVWLLTGGPVRLEGGAPRVGEIPGWSKVLLLLVLVAVLAAIWARARGRRVDAAGAPSLAALAALLALSPVFSLQYALWIAPWAAIAWIDTRTARYARIGFAISLLTGILSFLYIKIEPTQWNLLSVRWSVIGVLLLRDGLCVWIAVMWLRREPSLEELATP